MARIRGSRLRPLTDPERALALEHLYLADALACEAHRLCRRGVPLEELRGVARLALAEGTVRYDGAAGVPFGAYITRVIRHQLAQAVSRWSQRDRLHCLRFADLPDPGAGAAPAPGEQPCPQSAAAGAALEAREVIEQVRLALPDLWFRLLWLRHVEGRALEEIGRGVGLSGEHVRQLLCRAVRRARRLCPELWAG